MCVSGGGGGGGGERPLVRASVRVSRENKKERMNPVGWDEE